MKRVLVVSFSQSGQLAAVVRALSAPLQAAPGVELHHEVLQPLTDYPFPWPFWQFLDTFPETVLMDAPALKPLNLSGDEDFDLVILAYPIWFLSPPPPLVAFLQSDVARRLLAGKPVVTVTACRNMWLMAQDQVKRLLSHIGARHCDHVALTDQGGTLASFITTPRWLLTGKRNAFWGLPAAGVSAADIEQSARFGVALRDALAQDRERLGQPMLTGLRACVVDESLLASERVGIRSFRIWARLLRACGQPGAPLRRTVLAVYLLFLLTLIVTVVPLTMVLKRLLRPLAHKRLLAAKALYELPSGSATFRMPS